ncbi:MAG TPA: thioredoxin domain-containing protein [Candidatus Hydrogenedentes bacterium]|nr:thioredoxin domain-containing protein [Candidatus Hydrogenedentota bacterium]HPG65526.1 thioredoxin domain-containing protein [Candidatus Hydrogenedentota bacterium]
MSTIIIRIIGIIVGGLAGYSVGARKNKATGEEASSRQAIASALSGAVLGLILAMAAPYVLGMTRTIAWSGEVTPLTSQEDLDALVTKAGDKPVLLDFYASWCPPCRSMAPQVDKLAAEGHFVGVVNIEQALSLARSYDVEQLPTLVVLRGGKEVHRDEGYHGVGELRKIVEKYSE